MNNKMINNDIKNVSRKNKEQLLLHLINLEMQEMSDNQELASAFPLKGD